MCLRLFDVFLIGPITIKFSEYIKNPCLKLFVWVSGVLTILYNFVNFLRFTFGVEPSYLPESWTKLFYDPKHGKTQLGRKINLWCMYPLFAIALLNTQHFPSKEKWIRDMFVFFLVGGYLYNLKNYLKIQKHNLLNL